MVHNNLIEYQIEFFTYCNPIHIVIRFKTISSSSYLKVTNSKKLTKNQIAKMKSCALGEYFSCKLYFKGKGLLKVHLLKDFRLFKHFSVIFSRFN